MGDKYFYWKNKSSQAENIDIKEETLDENSHSIVNLNGEQFGSSSSVNFNQRIAKSSSSKSLRKPLGSLSTNIVVVKSNEIKSEFEDELILLGNFNKKRKNVLSSQESTKELITLEDSESENKENEPIQVKIYFVYILMLKYQINNTIIASK